MEIISINEAKAENILTVLRTETALSRFPLHLLTTSQDVQIELQNQSGAVYWSVSYNSKYGAPGQLAYKIDTLLVNRRIEEAGRHIPEVIRLGSLPEISRELDVHTRNWKAIRQALFQNASAFITAKILYRSAEGSEKWLEAGFTRYQIVLAGETLPTGVRADAVHIVLNSVYREVLSNAVFRPLDYDYMKTLPPIAQRFYEIVSYQIYAALKHKNPRAKLLYSDYCAYSTAKRYFDFDHVKKQMYKVLRPHVQSGYIAKAEYDQTTNERGETDWWMYYTPGPNAAREYRAFTGQGQIRKIGKRAAQKETSEKVTLNNKTSDANGTLSFGDRQAVPVREQPTPAQESIPEGSNQGSRKQEESNQGTTAEELPELIAALTAAELNRSDAERFAAQQPEICRRQLEYLAFIETFKTSRGAYLRRAIEGDFGPPAGWLKVQQQEQAAREVQAKRAQELLQVQQEKARESHEKRFYGAYLEFLRERVGEVEKTHPGAFLAFREWEEEQRSVYFKPPFAGRPINERALEVFDREESHLERFVTFFRGKGAPLPTFWQWDEQINTIPFG